MFATNVYGGSFSKYLAEQPQLPSPNFITPKMPHKRQKSKQVFTKSAIFPAISHKLAPVQFLTKFRPTRRLGITES
jgi:hypothetical protein